MSTGTNEDPNRAFYQQYTQTYPATQPNATTYPDMPIGMPMAPMMGMAGDEMGFDASFDPNNLFALGTMMDEGLFTFPLSFDNTFQF